MTNNQQTSRLTTVALRQAGLLVIAYIILIFVLPPSQATMHAYHLSTLEYRCILLAVQLPSLLAWLAAFFGAAKLQQYVQLVRKTDEGPSFNQLATGSSWLAWSLPVPAIASLLLNAIAEHWRGFHSTAIILSNYLNLILPLIAFTIIGGASLSLIRQAKLNFSLANARIIMIIFLFAGVLYCYLTFQRFDLTSLTSTANPYFLPIWLMVLSVIVPYLYAWFVGLLAAYEITLISRQTTGVLYRQALRLLVIGLVAIIVSSITLQYMNSVQPRVGHLMLGYQLVLTSIFRVIGGGGFVLMALGASRLKKIEEV